MADLIQLILLLVSFALLALCLFIGDKLVGNKSVKLTTSYYISALITAAIIVIMIILVGIIIGFIDFVGIGNITTILSFVVSVYVIDRSLKIGSYERATWVGIITWTMVYVINWVGNVIFQTDIIQIL